jgi:hypothetical protein
VAVYPPPVIESFTASESAIHPGQSVSLTAVFHGFGHIDSIGSITSGVPVSTAALASDTSFRLVVGNAAGMQVTQHVAVNVLTPPAIESFTAKPSPIGQGSSTTLTWGATGDISQARLDPLGIDVRGTNSIVVTPAATTTYVLTMSNALGVTTSASLQVEVVPPAVIRSFAATPGSTSIGGTAVLTADFDGTGTLEHELNGFYTALGPIVSGVPVTSAALRRTTGFRLVVRNSVGVPTTRDIEVAIVGPGTFRPVAQPNPSQFTGYQLTTLLGNGRVLIVDDGSTQLFDPVTETFSPGPVPTVRGVKVAVLMNDGRVLIAGTHHQDLTSIAEVYDPATGAMTAVGTLPAPGIPFHQGVVLADGRVLLLIAVRNGCCRIGGGALFDPSTNTIGGFEPSSVGGTSFRCGDAHRLSDGRVLVINGTRASEFYVPSSGFVPTVVIPSFNNCFTSARLQDGRVLMLSSSLNYTEIHDPASGTTVPTGVRQVVGSAATATMLPDGKVLVLGGIEPWAELYDPATGTFSETGGLRNGRYTVSATPLQDGRVLVIGTCQNFLWCNAEIYSP